MYFSALTAHFGQWLVERRRGRIGQKTAGGGWADRRSGEKKLPATEAGSLTHVMRLGTQADLTNALQRLGFSGRLNTAFIERVNLTVRHGVVALARRTWATSQQASQLLAYLEWWRA
ncbi:MAG TPA: hypothetical protein VFA10_25290 [Ktedonobacteraceae bacterium]|nr:hypothetical protein [Ktedonobacteraceae bacterium]